MMTRIKRAKWIIRLSLLALLILFVSIIALLWPSQNNTTADEMLAMLKNLKANGTSFFEARGLVGVPDHGVLSPDLMGFYQWDFPEEALLSMKIRSVWLVVNPDNKLEHAEVRERTIEGAQLWTNRWDRLKRRLGLD